MTVIEGCAVATVDGAGTEYGSGHVVLDGRRIAAVGPLRQAAFVTRLTGLPAALTTRVALRLATVGGAACLGRHQEIGSLEAGKLAAVCLWRLDGLSHAGITDPVAALVLGPPAPVELLQVNGRVVVSGAELRTAFPGQLARGVTAAAHKVRDLT